MTCLVNTTILIWLWNAISVLIEKLTVQHNYYQDMFIAYTQENLSIWSSYRQSILSGRFKLQIDETVSFMSYNIIIIKVYTVSKWNF